MDFDSFVTMIFVVMTAVSGGIYYGHEVYNWLRWR